MEKDIGDRYNEIRNYTVELCQPLSKEDHVPQPAEFVSPPKWHLGHTTWFFETFILKVYDRGYREYHGGFDFLFNSYYVAAGERMQRSLRGVITRPGVDEVMEYRSHVDEHMRKFLSAHLTDEQTDLIILGLNHEQQHQELLLSDLKYTFSLNPLFPSYQETAYAEMGASVKEDFYKISEGVYEVGFAGDGFHYDNEAPRHKVYLSSYEIAGSLVTNGEYMGFIGNGGYKDHTLWHSEGWTWVQTNRAGQPLYWHKRDKKWYQYTLAGMRELKPNHPVTHINYYEAYAFAQWKGMRLPTEFEWEVASDKFSWGDRWEWTESAYLPYPGFKKAPGAVGEYNGKFMVNQKILRGSSVITSTGHSRQTYRNFFHPEYSWQFTGIRLAK